jgi:hypothetical protein
MFFNNEALILLLLLLLQVRAPPLQAAQLSQAELEELLAENAKLKQMLNTYKDRLSPEQVRTPFNYKRKPLEGSPGH